MGEEIEVYFPNKAGEAERENIKMARKSLSYIGDLDNQDQAYRDAEYKKSDFHVRHFKLYLTIMYINENEVLFRYDGEPVNAELKLFFERTTMGTG